MTENEKAALKLEELRCKIVNGHEIARLGDLLADNYRHVHATGQVDDRDAAIKGFFKIPRTMTRGAIEARDFGDFVIMIGTQHNVLRFKNHPDFVVEIMATQVVKKIDGKWKFVSFHACKLGPLV